MANNYARHIRKINFALILFFFIGLAPVLEAQTRYFIDPNSDELRFIQRLAWSGGEYASRYEVTVEREVNGRYQSHLSEFTTALFFDVSLTPGQYRFRVIPYDVLDRPGEGSRWMPFIVRPALQPELYRLAQNFVFYDNDPVLILNVDGSNLVPGAEVFLVNKEGTRFFPNTIDDSGDGNSIRLSFNNTGLKSGDYEIIVINPGGLRTEMGGISVNFPEPGAIPRPEIASRPQTEPGLRPGSEPGLELRAGSEPGLRPGSEPGLEPRAGSEPGLEPGSRPGLELGAGSESGLRPGSEPGLEPRAGSELGLEAGSRPEIESGTEPGRKPRPEDTPLPLKPFYINLGMGWTPLIPVQSDVFDISLLAGSLNISSVFSVSSGLYIGPELTASLYSFRDDFSNNMVTVGGNILTQMRLPGAGFNLRIGASYDLPPFSTGISINMGISFFANIGRHFYMETGLDYIHSINHFFIDVSLGCFRPWLGIGFQF